MRFDVVAMLPGEAIEFTSAFSRRADNARVAFGRRVDADTPLSAALWR